MNKPSCKSVTEWIEDCKQGDQQAAQRLWNRYYAKLLNQARTMLDNRTRRVADEEDVVLCAFDNFFRATQAGRFPKLHDRDDLWQILLMLTERRAADQVKHEHRIKRGAGNVRGESAFADEDTDASEQGINQVVGPDPTPEFAAIAASQFQQLLDILDDETLRKIALLKMEGHTNSEIADEIECVEGTVERKLRRIRSIWSNISRDEDGTNSIRNG